MGKSKAVGVDVDKVMGVRRVAEKYIDLWLVYPDLLVDMMTPKDSGFSLFFYQRMYLRCCFRYKYFYATFKCRGFAE